MKYEQYTYVRCGISGRLQATFRDAPRVFTESEVEYLVSRERDKGERERRAFNMHLALAWSVAFANGLAFALLVLL